jgi:hypothetical protein
VDPGGIYLLVKHFEDRGTKQFKEWGRKTDATWKVGRKWTAEKK